MRESTEIKLSLTEVYANKLALWLNKQCEGGNIEYLKMKLGIETILINCTKAMAVYGVAILCNVLFQTLVLHSAYFAVRRVAFGLHAKLSVNCTIMSIFLFVGTSFLCRYIWLNNYQVVFLGLIFIACLYLYAPADTAKNPLIGINRRKKLRKEAITTCLFIMVIALLIPNQMIKSLLVFGVAIQMIFILPITYKILKRSRNNYEKYEEKING